MKTTRLHQASFPLTSLAILGIGWSCLAQENAALPLDAQNAKAEYSAQRKAGLLRLNQAYSEKLRLLQDRYTKAGNLESALAIKAEIDLLNAETAELQGTTASPEATTAPAAMVSPVVVLAENAPSDVVIEAKNEDGVALPKLKKGDLVTLQYVSGKWKSHGSIATEVPDALSTSHGDDNRLGIFGKKFAGSRPRLLTLAPAETATKPFTFEIPDDYESVVLRINVDPDGKWDINPGSVVYRVQLKRN